MWTINIKMPISFLGKLRVCFSVLRYGFSISVNVKDDQMNQEIARALAVREVEG